MKKYLFIITCLLIFTGMVGCVSMKKRREFSNSRYGSGGFADAPDNSKRSRLDQVKRVFNGPRLQGF